MAQKARFPFSWINKKTILALVVIAVLVSATALTVKFTVAGSYEGIFLLKGKPGALFEVKDDLYLGEGDRYIIGIDFEYGRQFFRRLFTTKTIREPYLFVTWNKKNGSGFIRNHLLGGKQLLTCFSRFLDDGGKETSGLFVGGGLPKAVFEDDIVKMNETGMAYYDGVRWFHIWCNVNEAIFTSKLEPMFPSTWKYLGSRILHHDEHSLILESSHEVVLEGVPLRIDRNACFRAGETYFVLSISIKNIGTRPATYYYLYGDEPWLGNYGTSGGNVGWSASGLYQFVGRVNPNKNKYAGLFDYGNDALGEGHDFTLTANFIEWFGDPKPNVYFSNGPYDWPQVIDKKIPLSSNTRFIGLQWGPRTLQPNQSEVYTMAIGMAGRDSITGFPLKPPVDPNNFP